MLEEKNDNLSQENETDGNLENKGQNVQFSDQEEVAVSSDPMDQINSEPAVGAEQIVAETLNVENAEPSEVDGEVVESEEIEEVPHTEPSEVVEEHKLDNEAIVSEETAVNNPQALTAVEEPKVEKEEPISDKNIADPITEPAAESKDETAVEKPLVKKTKTAVKKDPEASNAISEEAIVEENASAVTEKKPAAEKPKSTEMPDAVVAEDNAHQEAHDTIDSANAEESEDETLRHDLPIPEYGNSTMEELVAEMDTLMASENILAVRNHIEEIKKAFLEKYNHFIDDKKEEFEAENPDTTEEFHYHFPLKVKFDQLYNKFRDIKNAHFKTQQTNLKSNLENRLAIVEELKNLINPQENIKDTLKHFNELRDRWRNAGSIPKDKYNHVWNNYHFHVENFYDYLHLDREARDIDFKHNLELKLKIIARVEELIKDEDINKAFRELQDLHKIWKEDIGPVSREHREEIWDKFSLLTKIMHDKREQEFENLRGTELENLEKKKDIIAKLEVLAKEKVGSHTAWLAQIVKVEALRTEFFGIGKVPSEMNEPLWASFKSAVREFNVLKNTFYKDIKKDQSDNLSKKQALVVKAKELQDSTDFAVTTPLMKQIQEEWKKIGHIPKKYSEKLWVEFRTACNAYFEKLKEQKTEESVEEVEAFEKKKAYLDVLKAFEMVGKHKEDLDAIKLHIETWKSFGRVPFTRRHIEGKFNKILDALFEKLSLSKKDTELIRFSNRIDHMADSNDTRKIEGEKIFLMRKIEEVQQEILQLENNIQFFTNTKNAKKENSIVLEVRKNIAIHKEGLEVWKAKLKALKNLK